MSQVKLIKRYANRRLYDADTSKTITLDDVAGLIQAGHEVKVIDNISGEDITARVLGQTFLKISTDHYNMEFSRFLLTALIREVSSNVSRLFSQMIESGIGIGALTLDKLEKIVQNMVEHGDLQLSDKSDYVESILAHIDENRSGIADKAREGIGVLRTELSANRDRKVEELSGKLEEMARLIRDIQDRP